jgi:hypothetical protein
MSPLMFFFACVGVTLAAMAVYAVADFRRRAELRELARSLEMHFSPGDRFNQAAEVARRFPAVAPADPTITDVLYCRRSQRYCYVFRLDYTIGVTGPKLRRKAIVGFTEPCDGEPGEPSALAIADNAGTLVEQYRGLVERLR